MAVVGAKAPFNWKVIIEDSPLSASQVSFEPESQTAMIPWRIPAGDIDFAPRQFLGYSYRFRQPQDPGQQLVFPDQLRRELPAKHPFWEGFWGSRIQIQGELGSPDPNLPPFKVGNRFAKYDEFPFYRVEVYYTRKPYDVLPDGSTQVQGKEYLRYVEKLPGKSYYENVSIQGGQLIFLTKKGVPVQEEVLLKEGVSFRIPKTEFRWIWHEVPVNWILNSNGIAANLSLQVGTINKNAFAGYKAGTVLLDNVDLDYTWSTSPPTILGLKDYQPPRYVRAAFQFRYFKFGWQNLLFPGIGTWDKVAWKNDKTKFLYEETDFEDLFKLAVDTPV